MLDSIKGILSKSLNAGTANAKDAEEYLRIKLINQVFISGISVGIFNSFLNLLKLEWPDIIAGMTVSTILGLCYLLSYNGKHYLARTISIVTIISLMTCVQVLYGPTLKLEAIYLVFILVSIIGFTSYGRLLGLLFVTTAYLLGQHFAHEYGASYAANVSEFANRNYFVFSVLLISWQVYTMFELNKNQATKLESHSETLRSLLFSSAHNMRTPVHNINNYTQLIDRKIKNQNLDLGVQDYLTVLNTASRDIIVSLDTLQENLDKEVIEFKK